MRYQSTADVCREAAKDRASSQPPLEQPFSFAFVIRINGAHEPVRGYDHLSELVMCFELPQEAEMAAQHLPDVRSIVIAPISWAQVIDSPLFSGVLYVCEGRRGTCYLFERKYLSVSSKQYEDDWLLMQDRSNTYHPAGRHVTIQRELGRMGFLSSTSPDAAIKPRSFSFVDPDPLLQAPLSANSSAKDERGFRQHETSFQQKERLS